MNPKMMGVSIHQKWSQRTAIPDSTRWVDDISTRLIGPAIHVGDHHPIENEHCDDDYGCDEQGSSL